MTVLRTELARQIHDLRSLADADEVVRIRGLSLDPLTELEREEVMAVRKRLAGREMGRAA